MTIQLACVAFDCSDALTVGQFWSEALGRDLDPHASSEFASIGFAARRDKDGWRPVERRDDPTWIRPGARIKGGEESDASRPHRD